MSIKKSHDEIRDAVKKHYGDAITRTTHSCCGPAPVEFGESAIGRYAQMAGYTPDQLAAMPEAVKSFGCGNPVAFAGVRPGQTVLDLGSGAGLDLILAARKVGPGGKAIGLDMTPAMIETCRRNLKAADVANAEVRQGCMEQMPVADNEVDWIISNCVINLSPEKEKVFAEAFRVLKPGGQLMVSDIVTLDLPEELRDDIQAWVGCIAGAVDENEYLHLIKNAGFEMAKIVSRMVFDAGSIEVLANDCCGCGPSKDQLGRRNVKDYAGKIASARIYARKPG